MMHTHVLRTLGAVSLTTAHGVDLPLGEPGLIALLVLLAIAGDDGVSDDELLLRLTPSATAGHGRAEIERLVAAARERLGRGSAVVRTAQGYALTPGVVAIDVRVSPGEARMPSRELDATGAEFLAGFKLPGSPEFREWVEATRLRVIPQAVPTPAVRSRKARVGIVVGMAAIVAVVTAVYLARPRVSSAFATGDQLLVADVKNDTGDSLYGPGIMSAATVALQQSGRLRIFPRSRVVNVYRLMQIANPDTALSFELSKEVAQRDGTVRFVLGLEIARAGDGFHLTGRLADATGVEPPAEFAADARSKADVIAALDRIIVAVRTRLGESRREISDRRAPLPYVTTASLEALRSYSDGAGAWAKGDYRLANELWHRAVDLDTGFAMAYAALGRSYYFNHDRDRGERYFGEAFKRSGRLTEGERLRLQESAADYHGRPDSSVLYSAQLAERFPSVSTWYNYGTSLMALRRDSESVAAFEKALTFDPKHVSSFINLATVSKGRKRYEEALAYYARAAALDTVVLYRDGRNNEWGSTFVALGRHAEAESTFSKMARAPRVDARALGLRSLGFLAAWQGRIDDAIDFFRQAADASVQARSALGEFRNRLLLVTAYRTAGRDREANDEMNRALAIAAKTTFEPVTLSLAATVCEQMGRTADVRALLARIHERVRPADPVDASTEAYASALAALAANHPDSALNYAQTAQRYPMRLQRLALMSEAYRRLGQADSARAVATRLREENGFGFEGQSDWLHAPIVLGDLFLAARDTAAAIKQYQSFLEQWRAAPATQADVAATRGRLAVLRLAR